MTPSHPADKLTFYRETRRQALAAATARVRARLRTSDVVFGLIDDAALAAWTEQWRPAHQPGSPGGWDWARERRAWQGVIGRFEAALWHGPVLCGLALGKPSDGPSHLAVRLLEGNPVPAHPLRREVARSLLVAAEEYARALGKRELRLIQPLPGALPIYRALGFALAPTRARPPYCFVRF